MKEIINPVATLVFHQLDQVISFMAGSKGKAYMQVTGKHTINFARGAIGYNCVSGLTPGGKLFTATLNGNLKSLPAELGQGILVMELESGERLIIGEPELPVTLLATESLNQKSFQVSHKSWHQPYILAN